MKNRKASMNENIAIAVAAVCLALAFALVAVHWKVCADSNMKFVRGVAWFECVAR